MISFPNCKINIGLNITGKRGDGFHDIETVFYPVLWHDVLEIIPNNKYNGEDIYFESSGNLIPGNTANNLCIKAYQLLQKHHTLGPCSVFLHKSLPTGAGLGGGSSNASFTLLLLNKFFKLGLTNNQLKAYAAQLGSDCSFFIENKPLFAYGKGEILEPISLDLSKYYILLIKPPIHISTAEAYAGVSPVKTSTSLKSLIQQPINSWRESIVNDFEKSIFTKYKELEKIKNNLYNADAIYAAMSGSGSTIYGVFEKEPNTAPFSEYIVWKGKLTLP